MKPLHLFDTGSVEKVLLSYQALACDIWRVNHEPGESPTEIELHELTEALLARRVFELENSQSSIENN